MKFISSLVLSLALAGSAVAAHPIKDPTAQFIFFSVLEGLYQDGVANEDVDLILTQKNGEYAYFVYACPICMPVIHALEAYRKRPEGFYGLKEKGATYGTGLEDAIKVKLASENDALRLEAINELTNRWISRRIEAQRLTKEERELLQEELMKRRKEGMKYAKGNECAVCNGAVGKPAKEK